MHWEWGAEAEGEPAVEKAVCIVTVQLLIKGAMLTVRWGERGEGPRPDECADVTVKWLYALSQYDCWSKLQL